LNCGSEKVINFNKILRDEGMKKLPIGIQTFKNIIEEGYVYVDKTPFALKLIESGGKYYFLSRPRRFGKSLFLTTLKEIFEGNRDLFKGLYIYERYDFKPHPVIRISFGSGDYSNIESIFSEMRYMLKENMEDLGVSCENLEDYKLCFKELIRRASKKHREKVVILIDEYDKPILDNILNKDRAREARDILKNFYSVIKDMDEYIRFVFITGVSKFSKLNLFSGLNNLEDITVDTEYADICGYTQRDLETVFKEHLQGANMELVSRWYNGYNYFGERLYNPFDILLFISKKFEFRNYWWSTGSPTFLIDKLREENFYIPALEGARISEEELDAFDVERIGLLTLFWQTGYLTFKEKEVDEILGGISYILTVPNIEVQRALNSLFVDYLTRQEYEKHNFYKEISRSLINGDFESLINILKSIFASIPYQSYANSIISKYEGYYSSVVYAYLCALGYEVVPEDNTNRGRIDLTIKLPDKVVIIEFKVDSAEDPIEQIEKKRYYEKYISIKKPIYLIGIKFDSKERNILEWNMVKKD